MAKPAASRRTLIRPSLATVAAVACAVAISVPALAATGRASRPASSVPGYHVAATIKLGAFPFQIVEDPQTDTSYVPERGHGKFTTAVIDNHTDKVVARLPTFEPVLDTRTGNLYAETAAATGVAIISGKTHKVIKTLPLAAAGVSTVDPVTGHVYLTMQKGTSLSLAVLSDRTNKIIARLDLPAAAGDIRQAASPATGVVYAAFTSLHPEETQVWIISAKSDKVVAKINGLDVNTDGFAVDDPANLLTAMDQSSLTMINGKTHQVGKPVGVLDGTPEAGAQAVAVNPRTHTAYAAVECDPGSWVTVVNELTRKVVTTINVTTNNTAFRALGVDPSRDVIFAVNFTGRDVTVINGRTNSVLGTLPVGFQPTAVTVDPASGRAYVANSSNTVTVLAPSAASARPAPRAPVGSAGAASVLPAGQHRGFCG
jgi:DNA-binding beta-propeller fold protein YncE